MTNQITLILADDDEEDLALLQDAVFLSKDYIRDVKFVTNGIELLHRLRGEGIYEQDQNICQPDLVVIDLGMPGIDGFALLEEMKHDASLLEIPVVVLSGTTLPSDIKRCYDLGASGFMVKPHTPEELQVMLLQLIRYWSQLMRSPCNQNYKASESCFSSAA